MDSLIMSISKESKKINMPKEWFNLQKQIISKQFDLDERLAKLTLSIKDDDKGDNLLKQDKGRKIIYEFKLRKLSN